LLPAARGRAVAAAAGGSGAESWPSIVIFIILIGLAFFYRR
jgi:hypothetical protein